MKKNIVIIISIIIVVVLMSLVLVLMKSEGNNDKFTEDEIRFKQEYESVNGVELAENYSLKNIEIISDNNVSYVTDEEILELLQKGTNVIYFGWADCNWCRSIVPTLIDVLKDNNIDTLYYYDFKNLRNAYEKDTDDKKVKIYEDILSIIGEDIDSVFNKDSNRSGNKKILAPTVVFIKDGEFVGLHVKSVDSQINSTDLLTKKQIKELYEKYQTLLNQIKSNVCTTDEGC